MKRPSHRTQLCCGSPRLGNGARPFASLRASSFGFAQGKLLRLRPGQGYGARSGTAGAKPMLLSFDGTTKVVPSQQRESIQLR
jgi:hypothetical protein